MNRLYKNNPSREGLLLGWFGCCGLVDLLLVLVEGTDGTSSEAELDLLAVDYEGFGLQIGLPGTLNMPL